LFDCAFEYLYLFTIVFDEAGTLGERNLGRDLNNV